VSRIWHITGPQLFITGFEALFELPSGIGRVLSKVWADMSLNAVHIRLVICDAVSVMQARIAPGTIRRGYNGQLEFGVPVV
jgi:hypothetical protein